MIDILKQIGLPIEFNPETLEIIYDENIVFQDSWKKNLDSIVIPNEPLWKSMKFANEFTNNEGNTIKQPELKKLWNKEKLYFGYRGIYLNDKILLDLISNKNIMPDITILSPGTLDNEYIRTEGHEHLSMTAEIYEVISGNAVFLIFKTEPDNRENIEDIVAVFADVGDHVLFPPGYHHITINIGENPLIVTDWNSTKANSDFKFIKKHNGAPYWAIKGKTGPEFVRNPKYRGNVPEIRLCRPVEEIKEFQIKKGSPMFNLAKEGNINCLDFINNKTNKYNDVYKKAFVPI